MKKKNVLIFGSGSIGTHHANAAISLKNNVFCQDVKEGLQSYESVFSELDFRQLNIGTVIYISDKNNDLQFLSKQGVKQKKYWFNKKYWSNKEHWQWATKPNRREKASFLKENIIPIQKAGHLNFVENEGKLFDNFNTLFVNGHTEAQMIPHITYKNKTIVFAADLLPSTGHIPLPYVMGYDIKPLVTLAEKEKFLNKAAEKEYIIYLQHDNYNECCTVQQTEKGVRLKDTFKLTDIM